MTIRFGHSVAHSAILEVNHESIMGVTECTVTLSLISPNLIQEHGSDFFVTSEPALPAGDRRH